jgi:hypothetical protein
VTTCLQGEPTTSTARRPRARPSSNALIRRRLLLLDTDSIHVRRDGKRVRRRIRVRWRPRNCRYVEYADRIASGSSALCVHHGLVDLSVCLRGTKSGETSEERVAKWCAGAEACEVGELAAGGCKGREEAGVYRAGEDLVSIFERTGVAVASTCGRQLMYGDLPRR